MQKTAQMIDDLRVRAGVDGRQKRAGVSGLDIRAIGVRKVS